MLKARRSGQKIISNTLPGPMNANPSTSLKPLKRLKLLKPLKPITTERKNQMKTQTKQKLSDVLKGTQVSSWEIRINDKGQRVIYVRYRDIKPVITVTVNEE